MDFKTDERNAILAKSLILIEKTTSALTQLDHWRFPTDSSEFARKLLVQAHERLRNPTNLVPVDPAVLYNRLFSLQELAELIERSSTDHISWPLVSYCDEIWRQFFDHEKIKIFYSVTSEHNYSILRFSKLLSLYLRDVLPSAEISALTGGIEVYCLQLASSEDANLPLYANIGHEFGHAVFDARSTPLVERLNARFTAILPLIFADFQQMDANKAVPRFQRTAHVIVSMAQELFCDLVGTMLMGPAFFLSLFEIAWGESKAVCKIRLAPDEQSIRAYPSFQFRLHCIRRWAEIDGFCKAAKEDFAKLKSSLQTLADCLATVPTSHSDDSVKLRPSSDDDADAIVNVVEKHLPQMKQAMEEYLEDCQGLMMQWYSIASPVVSTADVGELLHRLENSILPNIVPTESLLGRPATFASILNACALYRLHLLTTGSAEKAKELSRDTGIVERLTAKAFEVSFIQREFAKWQGGLKHGSSEPS